jgi:hypothetical protein
MHRSRTLLALAGMTLMTAVVGSAGMTGAFAQTPKAPNPAPDFQGTGSHLNDPANKRNSADKRDADFQAQGSHLDDPANKRGADDKADKPNPK